MAITLEEFNRRVRRIIEEVMHDAEWPPRGPLESFLEGAVSTDGPYPYPGFRNYVELPITRETYERMRAERATDSRPFIATSNRIAAAQSSVRSGPCGHQFSMFLAQNSHDCYKVECRACGDRSDIDFQGSFIHFFSCPGYPFFTLVSKNGILSCSACTHDLGPDPRAAQPAQAAAPATSTGCDHIGLWDRVGGSANTFICNRCTGQIYMPSTTSVLARHSGNCPISALNYDGKGMTCAQCGYHLQWVRFGTAQAAATAHHVGPVDDCGPVAMAEFKCPSCFTPAKMPQEDYDYFLSGRLADGNERIILECENRCRFLHSTLSRKFRERKKRDG